MDRHTDRLIVYLTDRQQMHKQMDRQTYKQTDRRTDRCTNRQTGEQTYRQKNTHTHSILPWSEISLLSSSKKHWINWCDLRWLPRIQSTNSWTIKLREQHNTTSSINNFPTANTKSAPCDQQWSSNPQTKCLRLQEFFRLPGNKKPCCHANISTLCNSTLNT